VKMARFVYAESGHANSNITLISILRPLDRTGRARSLQGPAQAHREPAALSPIFRQKLLRVPLELDFPYWIEDESFDLEYHVRHIACRSPATAPVLYPGLAHPCPASRPEPSALGNVPGRGPRLAAEPAERQLRHPRQDPPCRDRRARRRRDHDAAARHDADPAAAGTAGALVPESPPGAVSLLARALVNNIVRPLMFAAP